MKLHQFILISCLLLPTSIASANKNCFSILCCCLAFCFGADNDTHDDNNYELAVVPAIPRSPLLSFHAQPPVGHSMLPAAAVTSDYVAINTSSPTSPYAPNNTPHSPRPFSADENSRQCFHSQCFHKRSSTEGSSWADAAQEEF